MTSCSVVFHPVVSAKRGYTVQTSISMTSHSLVFLGTEWVKLVWVESHLLPTNGAATYLRSRLNSCGTTELCKISNASLIVRRSLHMFLFHKRLHYISGSQRLLSRPLDENWINIPMDAIKGRQDSVLLETIYGGNRGRDVKGRWSEENVLPSELRIRRLYQYSMNNDCVSRWDPRRPEWKNGCTFQGGHQKHHPCHHPHLKRASTKP